ncbi:MAG TPA: addiction module protein, partial [Phycisphaerae bacterium]|nr:addiction module protein [Phycisphaerae bacterium]
MSTPVDKIISEALQLPAQARAFVAEKLIDSLDAEPGDELSPAWREEVSKRCRQIDEGLVELRDAEGAPVRLAHGVGSRGIDE